MPHHLPDVNAIETCYDHIYLSPHLDDAALSCGGAIARHANAGQRVLVVTIGTGEPSAETAFSAFASHMHEQWQLAPAEAVRTRLNEDLAAMEVLGADSCWLGLLDAIYRMPLAYVNDETLFGDVAPDDNLGDQLGTILQTIYLRCPTAIYYAPLGVGNHVDHQVLFATAGNLARQGAAVAYYEDYPYVQQPGALAERLDRLGGVYHFLPSTLDIDATLARKIGAIESYTSQIGILFGSAEAMARQVTDYAEELRPEQGTYGERLWLSSRQSMEPSLRQPLLEA